MLFYYNLSLIENYWFSLLYMPCSIKMSSDLSLKYLFKNMKLIKTIKFPNVLLDMQT